MLNPIRSESPFNPLCPNVKSLSDVDHKFKSGFEINLVTTLPGCIMVTG